MKQPRKSFKRLNDREIWAQLLELLHTHFAVKYLLLICGIMASIVIARVIFLAVFSVVIRVNLMLSFTVFRLYICTIMRESWNNAGLFPLKSDIIQVISIFY